MTSLGRLPVVILVAAAVVLFGACSAEDGPAAPGRPGAISELAAGPAGTDRELAGLLDAHAERERARELRAADAALAEEAIAAVRETRTAVEALEQDDHDAALAALERALGKLEVLLARRPDLGLVPLEVRSEVVNPVVPPDRIDAVRERVEELLAAGDLQGARLALNGLASEIRVTTVNLPLETYPVAIRRAARLLDEGEADEAERSLRSALLALLVTERHIPLPLVNAHRLVAMSSDRRESDADEALELLSRAQQQLRMAERLGYGRRDGELEGLDEEIDALKRAIGRERDPGDLFETLAARLEAVKERLAGRAGAETEPAT